MNHRQQSGFTIVSAIFILVVLAALGAFIVNISTSQQIGSALDVQGARAYQAARAGIEWGVYQVQASSSYQFGFGASPVGTSPRTTANPNLRACPASPSSFTLPAPTMTGFTVTVTCTATTDLGSTGPTVYKIVATACNQPSGGSCPNTTDPGGFYIERRLEVSF